MNRSGATSLRSRFLRIGLLVALVKLVAVITLVWTSVRLAGATEMIVDSHHCADVTSEALTALSGFRREVLLLRLTGDGEHAETAEQYRQQLETMPLDQGCHIANPAHEGLVASLDRAIREYLAIEDEARSRFEKGEPAEVSLAVQEKFRVARQALQELDVLNTSEGMRAAARAKQVQTVLRQTGTVVGIVSILVVASLLLMLQWGLVDPMHRLTEAIRGMKRNGVVGARLGLNLQAELGEIERAVDELSERVAERRTAQYQLIASVAHDLKNPLQSIRAYSSFVRPDKPLPPERVLRQGFDIIGRQAEKLTRQLEDLLDAAKVQGGSIEIEKKTIDLRDLVHEAGASFLVVSEKHRIEVDAPQTLPTIGDPLRLGQVLSNLIGNAVKYSPAGGRVVVALREVGREAWISVRDEGIGIEAENIATLFEPFRRSNSVRGMNIPGVGLGLSTSRWIVEAHGGCIEVESEPGQGSTFTVRLPLASVREMADEGPCQAPSQPSA